MRWLVTWGAWFGAATLLTVACGPKALPGQTSDGPPTAPSHAMAGARVVPPAVPSAPPPPVPPKTTAAAPPRAGAETEADVMSDEQVSDAGPVVRDLIALRSLDRAALLRRLDIGPDKVQDGVGYERLRGLSAAYDPQRSPARFYFRGDALVMIYLSDAAALAGLEAGALAARLGAPTQKLRSRAGKKFKHYAYPTQGLAFTFRKATDPVRFLEVFPPMSPEAYLAEIYEEPPPFRK